MWSATVPPLPLTAEFTTLVTTLVYNFNCGGLVFLVCVGRGFFCVSLCLGPGARSSLFYTLLLTLNCWSAMLVVLLSGVRPVPSRVVVALLPVGSPLFARSSIPPALPAHAHVPSCAHLPPPMAPGYPNENSES